jgi:NAD(P)-dependent dehydrogenase (short-subunit alcohol dehydrogenase family)
MDLGLRGRVALVAGSSAGLGFATARTLAAEGAHVAVNGRDAARLAAGIVGNFTLEEAVGLAGELGFAAALGHHFGMFDFNTIDEASAASLSV